MFDLTYYYAGMIKHGNACLTHSFRPSMQVSEISLDKISSKVLEFIVIFFLRKTCDENFFSDPLEFAH